MNEGAEKQTAGLDEEPEESLVIVARAVRPKGLKGEIVAELLTDFPDRFNRISQFFAISPKGEQTAVKLERFSFHKDRVVLKLAGYDTIESASTLVGYEFAVPESERVELAADEFYDWELEGCQRRDCHRPVGRLSNRRAENRRSELTGRRTRETVSEAV